MNLEQSNAFRDAEIKNDRRKKLIGAMFILCIIAIVVLLLLIQQIKKVDAATLKFYIDGQQKTITSTLFYSENGINYINVKELAQLLGVKYTAGQYQQYNESDESCYITDDFEDTTITVGENKFQKIADNTNVSSQLGKLKIDVKTEDGTSSTFVAEVPPIFVNQQIYIPFSSLRDMFSISVDDSNAKRIKFYTLAYLYETYAGQVNKSGYQLKSDYENIKALLYNVAVVGEITEDPKEPSRYYGVISIGTPKSETKIGLKYDDITFIQNTGNFIIKSGNTVGILDQEGGNVIKPDEYDDISIYDDEHMLYLVKKDGNYGVVDKKGNRVIYTDYEEIGLLDKKDFEFPENSGNYKVLFDKAIVVRDNGKFGLFDLDGNEMLGANYDEFGCNPETARFTSGKITNEKPVVTIPESVGINGLVINKDGLYGIYDMAGTEPKIIVPTTLQKVYSITREGKTTYYIEYLDQSMDLHDFLVQQNLVSVGSGVRTTNPVDTYQGSNQSQESNPDYNGGDQGGDQGGNQGEEYQGGEQGGEENGGEVVVF